MYVFVISLIIISIIILSYYQVLAQKRLDKAEYEINNIKVKNEYALKAVINNQEKLEQDMKEFFEKNEEYNRIFQEKLEKIEKYTKKNN